MSRAPRGRSSGARRLGVARALVGHRLVAGDIEVGDGRIAAVGLQPAGSGTAVPGLVDIQVNGYAGADVSSGDGDAVRHASRALAADGVLAWCPTVVTSPEEDMIRALRAVGEARAAEDGSEPAARIIGAHVEGPFLSPRRPGVHPLDLLRAPDRSLADRFLAAGPVAILSLAPELPGALELIGSLAERGVVVSAGHTDATAAEARAGFDAGVRATTHTWNGMRPLVQRDPGVVGAALTDPRVHLGLIGDGVHVAEEVLLITWRAARGRICLITDAVAAAAAPDGRYRLGPIVIERRDGRVHDLEGRVGGGATPLLHAVRVAVASGIALADAVAAASSIPAALLGRRVLGTLRRGGPADLIVLGDGLTLERVLVGGRELAA